MLTLNTLKRVIRIAAAYGHTTRHQIGAEPRPPQFIKPPEMPPEPPTTIPARNPPEHNAYDHYRLMAAQAQRKEDARKQPGKPPE